MGCCQAGRPQRPAAFSAPEAPLSQATSDCVHLTLIKAHRERDSSRLLPLLDCHVPLRLKFRCKKVERVSSLACYMLAAYQEQYSVVVKSGTVGKILDLCTSDKHALSSLYLMASQSEEVLQRISDFSPIERLAPILDCDKQSALITSLLLGLLCSLTPSFAVTVVKLKGLFYGLKIYAQLHHFEAKRDMLKAMYSVVHRAKVERNALEHLGDLLQELGKTGDVALQRLRRLLQGDTRDIVEEVKNEVRSA